MPTTAANELLHGERLARVEAKLEANEKGIDVIRGACHAINGEMQKFVGLEARCVSHLEQLVESSARRDQVLADITSKVASFDELKPRLQTVIDEYFARKGGWKATTMIITAAMGAVTMIGTIGAGVIWMLGKVGGH